MRPNCYLKGEKMNADDIVRGMFYTWNGKHTVWIKKRIMRSGTFHAEIVASTVWTGLPAKVVVSAEELTGPVEKPVGI